MTTVESVIIFHLIVGVGIGAVECTMDSVLMIMDWLNIMLVIESVVEDVVVLVINFMAILMVILRHIAMAVMGRRVSNAM